MHCVTTGVHLSNFSCLLLILKAIASYWQEAFATFVFDHCSKTQAASQLNFLSGYLQWYSTNDQVGYGYKNRRINITYRRNLGIDRK